MIYTIQVSNHPKVFGIAPPEEAVKSWRTVFDGDTTPSGARTAANAYLATHRFVRVFQDMRLLIEMDAEQYRNTKV